MRLSDPAQPTRKPSCKMKPLQIGDPLCLASLCANSKHTAILRREVLKFLNFMT